MTDLLVSLVAGMSVVALLVGVAYLLSIDAEARADRRSIREFERERAATAWERR